jgi:hypothetical protein
MRYTRLGWIKEEKRLVGLPLTFIIILLFLATALYPTVKSTLRGSKLTSKPVQTTETIYHTKLACEDEKDAVCWIHYYAHRYGQDPHLVTRIAEAESNLKPNAVGFNSNGTKDVGLLQINDIHGISMECRLDIHCNLEHAMIMMQTAGTTPWNASKHKWYE